VEPLAEAFCRVHELHYQTKAREDGLHENFGCYNFAYRKDMKTPVVSYRTKWPTGWKTEWFYVKIDEKKEKLVQSPLELTFGLTRPQCNMTSGSSRPDVVGDFRVVSEHIGTRDLVQEYLANRVFPTLKEWSMPKPKGEKKKNELVRLPYHLKFKKHFKEPCQEWLDTIEVMCNEILGNYMKKEDQLMIAAFGTRPKRRLNRVMDALNFEYPNYERLNKGAEGQKRKRIVSVLSRQAARMVKEDEEILKRRKSNLELKVVASKKRKAAAPKQKATDVEEETPSIPSVADVEEILKVMTESLPIKLSPLGPHLTKLLQKKKVPSAAKKSAGPKKRRIITVTEAIEETPPPTSASKTPAVDSATVDEAAPPEAATAEAATAEDTNLESTFSDIDKMLLDMPAEEAATATEETLATVPGKEKETAEDTSEEKDFDFQNIIGQELSKAEKEELRDYAISCGYKPGALLFGGIDNESLGCLRDQTGAKVISTLSKSIGFPKLEADISHY
jgi:1,2-phenylacetyl-CoA epoxidase PaaB subunit